jgi:DNA polymerase III subunit gamma/tau
MSAEQFIVSARKYRPAEFATVVGQHHITDTLKNAIKNNHLAQAFLFCGPRGVGKTTCARILAKTINCQNLTKEFEACNECDSCKNFNEGRSLNIHELDAASNNSVDDIRNLIDQVRFAPQMGTKKVYIIDEVHMLSTAAFNAFLKTLEEPPAHAIFILATTEKHKIIPTILSRCQIFDFRRIQLEDITNHLVYISQKENITSEKEGLSVIAQKADGALRDALSIFDQIVSFSGNNITYQDVIDNLNILDYEYYFSIVDAALNNNIPSSLLKFDDILNKGFNGHHFIVGLAEHLRNLLVCKDPSTIQLLEVGEKTKAKYSEQANNCSQEFLLQGLAICNQCDLNYKASKNQRLIVELALMQLCSVNTASGDEKKNFNGVSNIKFKIILSTKKIAQDFVKKEQKTVEVEKTYTHSPEISSAKAEESKPKIVTKKSIGSLGLSIKGTLQKKENEATIEDSTSSSEPAKKNNFTKHELLKAWNLYAEKFKNEGKDSFYTTLTKHQPKLTESYKIIAILENRVQVRDFDTEKIDLLGYLKSSLQNDLITIDFEVIQAIENNNAYTNKDKFLKMAKKNAAMQLLKDKLDLDIEY